ncbi:MAG: LysR family transcriptional regulator [Rhodobacteraceae bacterium]|nr:LysR family transcriptional regulator [Paracoccaceae bacterium]
MNWSAIAFDWNQARAFLVTAETGSFSAAARALRLTQPTLGRQVAALEAELGVTLFERVGRALELTDAGRSLLGHMREMGEAAIRVSLAASGQVQQIAGSVSVSVSDIFAQRLMPMVALRLQDVAPQISLEVIASNALSDLQRREADIAIRHVRPVQPELFTKMARRCTGRLYATQDYVARHGPFDRPADLARASYIAMGDGAELVAYLQGCGVPITPGAVRHGSENGVVCWEMLRAGLGLFPMLDDIAATTPGVVPVWPGLKPIEVECWLTVHRELHTSRRIRLVFDMLAEMLAQPRLPLT